MIVEMSSISNTDFIKLLLSIMVINNDFIFDNYELENKLGELYNDPKYKSLLKNIILSNNNTLDFVKFYSALSLVHAVGLAKLIQNSKISKTIIILSKNEAEEILNSYSKNVVSLVKDIYNEIYKPNAKTLNKIKKL